jgi:pimeloyl-ACP methyl ester carboxylesterase
MSAMGKMLSDYMYAVDVLCEVKRVDSARIAVAGHGMGAANALFLAAFDERIQACVASCGFTRFAADKNPERWAPDSGFVSFPLLREAIKKGEFPFDWEHILALLAPSPTLVVTALNDATYSNTKSCEKAVQLASSVYKLLGASEALADFVHEGGHRITPEALEVADEWLERWL